MAHVLVAHFQVRCLTLTLTMRDAPLHRQLEHFQGTSRPPSRFPIWSLVNRPLTSCLAFSPPPPSPISMAGLSLGTLPSCFFPLLLSNSHVPSLSRQFGSSSRHCQSAKQRRWTRFDLGAHEMWGGGEDKKCHMHAYIVRTMVVTPYVLRQLRLIIN